MKLQINGSLKGTITNNDGSVEHVEYTNIFTNIAVNILRRILIADQTINDDDDSTNLYGVYVSAYNFDISATTDDNSIITNTSTTNSKYYNYVNVIQDNITFFAATGDTDYLSKMQIPFSFTNSSGDTINIQTIGLVTGKTGEFSEIYGFVLSMMHTDFTMYAASTFTGTYIVHLSIA